MGRPCPEGSNMERHSGHQRSRVASGHWRSTAPQWLQLCRCCNRPALNARTKKLSVSPPAELSGDWIIATTPTLPATRAIKLIPMRAHRGRNPGNLLHVVSSGVVPKTSGPATRVRAFSKYERGSFHTCRGFFESNTIFATFACSHSSITSSASTEQSSTSTLKHARPSVLPALAFR